MKEGFTVATRGRLAPEILSAYAAAHATGTKPAAKPAAPTPKARVKQSSTPVKNSAGTRSAANAVTAKPKALAKRATQRTALQTPSTVVPVVTSDPIPPTLLAQQARLEALESAVEMLTIRVAELEKPAGKTAKRIGRHRG
jgi:hypothetical protein